MRSLNPVHRPHPSKHISHLFHTVKHKKNNVRYQVHSFFFFSKVHKLGKSKSFNNNDKSLASCFAVKS